jgi:hypothetical protein
MPIDPPRHLRVAGHGAATTPRPVAPRGRQAEVVVTAGTSTAASSASARA